MQLVCLFIGKILPYIFFFKYRGVLIHLFFSLDVEGAEFPILQTIPWDKVDIQVSHKISTRCQRYDHVISGFGVKEFSIKILL